MNNMVKKIIIQNAGLTSANGEYIRNLDNPSFFDGPNGNFLELTVDGWYLIDTTINEQAYWFSENFDKVGGAGDNIMPIPSFQTFND